MLSNSRRAPARPTCRTPALATALALFTLGAVPAASPAPVSEAPARTLEEWFLAHPDARTTPSSGWKPYQRLLWLAETRGNASGVPAFRLRADAVDLAVRHRAARSSQAGWFATGPTDLAGRCLSVDFDPTDPGVVYLGAASGGLWKSTDGGDNWSPITDDLPTLAIGAVCVLASDPNVVLIGTGEGSGAASANLALGPFGAGIFKSTDAGATWQTTNISYGGASSHGFSVIEDEPSTGVILAGANDGLYRSTDDGDTWTQVETNANYFDVKWKPGDPSRVYVTRGRDPFFNFPNAGNGVRVSTDGGLTFARAGTGQPTSSNITKTKIAVTAADPSVIYAHFVNFSTFQTLGIYRSTDDGANWSLRSTQNMTGSQGWYNLVMAADPDDPDRIVTGGTPLHSSNDGGLNYTQETNSFLPGGNGSTPHWDLHGIAYEPGNSDALWVLTDGGPWRSTDDGSTWTSRREGLVTYQFYDICVAQTDPLVTLGGTQDNGIPRRVGPDSWLETTLNADGMVCNVHPTNKTIVYGEAQFGNHFKSLNGGLSWSQINTGITGGGLWVTPVDQSQTAPRTLYTMTTSGIFKTTNGGNLWTNVAPHAARWISISPVDENVVWTVSNFVGLWVTTDGGATWTLPATFPATGTESKVHADPADPASAFVTFGYYGTGSPRVLRTTDYGASWLDVSGDLPDIPANTFVADPDRPDDWYVGTDVGVWSSTDGGVTWTPFGTGLPNALIVDLEIQRSGRKLVAGTHGRGAWEVDLPAGAVDAPAVAAGAASPNLMLDPPSPNPVRDTVVLRYAARSEGAVTLEVYDVSGRRVDRVAATERGDAVVRTAVWDARRSAPGVYFARLTAGAESVTRKVVVAR